MLVTWHKKSRSNSVEARAWDRWFAEIPSLRKEYFEFIGQDHDVFSYNEASSAGLFACGAARARMIALPEYVCLKKGRRDKRRRVNGRADLWIYDPHHKLSWCFEFKHLLGRTSYSETLINKKLEAAVSDAACIVTENECDKAFGAVLISCRDRSVFDDDFFESIINVARDCDYCVEIGGGAGAMFLLIKAP